MLTPPSARGGRPALVATLAAFAAAALLAGCSLFGEGKPKPKELQAIVAPIAVRPVWNQQIGAVHRTAEAADALAHGGGELVDPLEVVGEIALEPHAHSAQVIFAIVSSLSLVLFLGLCALAFSALAKVLD